jgi:tRNA nucleotidyltransferase/poly(A) polymerase
MRLRELLDDLGKITTSLNLSPAMICGGTAREKVMRRLNNIDDLDITTGDQSVQFLAKEFAILLGKHYSFDQKHMPDGHTSITLGNIKVDFSSNFNVPNITELLVKQGITNPTDMQREMFSRDFTCNALLLGLDLKTITDPTGKGISDIHAKVIRTCLDPSITMTTNKNRVVRAIYLAAKLDFDLDQTLSDWIRANPTSMKLSSPHTITEKLNKAMDYDPDKTAMLLTTLNLWEQIPITDKLQPYYSHQATQ